MNIWAEMREEIADMLPFEIHATRKKLAIADQIINIVLDEAIKRLSLCQELKPTQYHIAVAAIRPLKTPVREDNDATND